MNPQLSATDFQSICNWASGVCAPSIRNYPQPDGEISATPEEAVLDLAKRLLAFTK